MRRKPSVCAFALAFAVATIVTAAPATSLAAQGTLHRGFRVNPDVAFRIMVPAGRVRVVAWEHDSIDVVGTLGKNSTFYGGGSGAGAKMGIEARLQKDSVLADA